MPVFLNTMARMEKRIPDPMAQLDANEAALARRLVTDDAPYIPPAEKFYHSNYVLDGCVAADLRTAFGYFKSAQKQLLSFAATQRPDGMVPGVSHPPTNWTWNPERWLSTTPFEGNDYTQTPAWAHSVLVLHDAAAKQPPVNPEQAIDSDKFLHQIYPHLARYYDYFINNRQVASDDPRVFILHPHEANRDSGPEYEQWKQQEMQRQLGRLAMFFEKSPRTGEHMPPRFNKANRRNDYFGALAINLAGYKAGWEPARIRETSGEFVDVWFNTYLYENYHSMAELAARLDKTDDQQRFSALALGLENSIKKNHYFADARDGKGAFYSTYQGAPTKVNTIGNLVTLLLRNLESHQLQSNLDLMDEGFKPRFPLPSVATFETAYYDPHYEEYDRHWQGPKWPVADVKVMRGLDIQLGRTDIIPEDLRLECLDWFYAIHESNLAVVEITGDYAEHNNPVTGMGQRLHRTRGHTFGVAAHMPISTYTNISSGLF
jgi:hypothetical protein